MPSAIAFKRRERVIADAEPDTGRLALCGRDGVRNAIDGAWWPNTDDLAEVLPDLMAVMGSWVGPVRRVVYDPRIWPHAPARVVRGATSIAVDPYRLVDRDTILLIGTHARDAVLFVVSPTTAQWSADRVLRAVAASTEPFSAVSARALLGCPGSGADPPELIR